MTSLVNVFPNYPVVALDRDGDPGTQLTVMTPALEAAARFVEQHLASRTSTVQGSGINVAVRGDFGTGKTHLLGFAARSLRAAPQILPGPASVVSVATMETSPIEWYRAAVGPALGRVGLEQLTLALYAEAAQKIAASAPATAAAIQAVGSDPARARTLVEQDLLNPTAVEIAFIDMIETMARDTSEVIRHAIAGLITSPRVSARWLEGATLTLSEAQAAGLPQRLETDEQVADAIVAIAALHARVHRPFMFAIDELEHLTRADDTVGTNRNTTWLKRLLEQLRLSGALTFVAGHTSAWDGRRDFADRFTPGADIELSLLGATEVLNIVQVHVGHWGLFTPDSAALVSELAGGNVRRILALLRELFDKSAGFAQQLSDQDIRDAAAAMQSRVDPQRAIDNVVNLLTGWGLRVVRSAVVSGVAFDMVADRAGVPVAAIEIKHATFGMKQQDQARGFIDKMRTVSREVPLCVGIFLSEGSLDSALSELSSEAARMMWFDITQSDFLARLRTGLAPIIAQPPAAVPVEAPAIASVDAAERDIALVTLQDEIRNLTDSQSQMYAELFDRLSSDTSSRGTSLSFHAPASAEVRDRTRAIYEELSRPPSLARRTSYILDRRGFVSLVVVIIGVGGMICSSSLADAIALDARTASSLRTIFLLAGLVCCVGGLLGLLSAYLALDRFTAFRQDGLRDAYLRDASPEELIDLNQTLESALAEYGPRWARRELGAGLSVPGVGGNDAQAAATSVQMSSYGPNTGA